MPGDRPDSRLVPESTATRRTADPKPRTRRAVLGTIAAASLAGCLDGTGGGASPTDTPSPSPMGTTEGMGGTSLAVRDHPDLGEILVDGEGMTLYMFDKDEQGAQASACTGSCLDAWPPLTADGTPETGSGVTADVGTFERADGDTQVTAGGWPLYYYASDGSPGDAKGQGVGGVWWVLRPDGTPVRASSPTATASPTATMSPAPAVQVREDADLGEILVGPDELTLYMFDNDTQGSGSSACSGGCADNWPPLTVEGDPQAGDGVTASLSTFERGDGTTQVAANGWPLYYYAGDSSPGDTAGQGVGDVWWVLGPDGSPIRDSSDDGY